MKTLLLLLLLGIVSSTYGQIKTKEKSVTVDEVTGDTTITSSVTISDFEDITPRNHMLIINPLKFFLFYNISYYHRLSDAVGIGAGFQIPTPRGVEGFGVNAEVRFYPTGKMLRGFYIAPNFSYNEIKAEDESINPVSFGTLLGWQWFPGDEFAIGLGIGVDYYFTSITPVHEDVQSYTGFVPALRFDIGYAW